ncbi:hypothetical protein Tco_0772208 [Tanacetum coccineum]|uniref:Uncharacterized protein n=1 Tax=Tanacetum coccineum TaxID=301880 RepID=A0ABQ4ZK63_9ASTR
MISSIPIGGSISPEGFLLPVLLVVVIIVTVVIVIVILIVVVDDASLILKLSFTVERVPVSPVFLLRLLALAIDAAYAFRAEEMPSLNSCWMAAKVMAVFQMLTSFWEAFYQHRITRIKNDITSFGRGYGMIHEDGDNDAISGNDDERAISWKQ